MLPDIGQISVRQHCMEILGAMTGVKLGATDFSAIWVRDSYYEITYYLP